MKEAVPLPVVRAWRVGCQDVAVIVHVPGVEELVVFVARSAAARHVGPDVVEGAEAAGKVDMAGVVQPGAAEDEETVLVFVSLG